MRLRYIELTLENCEVVTIDGKYIGDYLVDDISTSISRLACNWVGKVDWAGLVAIEIHKDAGEEYYFLDGRKGNKFSRLTTWNDITHIDICLEEDVGDDSATSQTYSYAIDWDDSNDGENKNQESYISDLGNLYIYINSKKSANNKGIFDFFDKEAINDKDYSHFRFLMFGIEKDEDEKVPAEEDRK